MSNLERKLERLDDAFLFLLSFTGLVITIIQVNLFGTSFAGLVEIIPLLFIGIVMPFYVGYLRGGISIDSINRSFVERIRGWIYLIIGISAYFGYVVAARFPFQILWLITPFNIFMAIGVVLTYLLLKWLLGVFPQEIGINISHEYAFSGTILSAFLFAFFLRMIISMYSDLQPNFQYSSLLLTFFWFTSVITWMLLVYEKISRNIINARLSLNAKQIERRQHQRVTSRFFTYNVDILILAFGVSRKSSFLWKQGSYVGLFGMLMLYLGFPILADAYLWTSIILGLLGTIHFLRLRIDFSQLRTL